jgi:diguanylate cyclase (GGDEF)-like protein
MVRHRRAVEAGQLAARACGIVLTAMLVAGRLDFFPDPVPVAMTAMGVGMITVMVTAEVLGAVNFCRPLGRRYSLRSVVQVSCDLIVMCGFVGGLRLYADATIWPALIVPIVAGALRFRLPGALIAWAVTSAFLPFALSLGDRPVPGGELVFALCIHLIVAVISGTQAGAFTRQVRELDALRCALEHQAGHDALTGLPNRARLTRSAAGYDGRSLAVLLLDLNGFKQVNDTLGHAGGDAVLCATARRVDASVRDGDLAGRLGGDEFLVLLPDTGPAEAAVVMRRLRAEITRPLEIDGRTAEVGVSIGAAYRGAGEGGSLEALTVVADRAMYSDKTAALR